MGFDLFSPIVLDIQIWISFDPILDWRQNKGLGMGHNIFTKLVLNMNYYLEKNSYWIWSFNTVQTYNTNLAPFWANFDFMDSHVLLNFQILGKWRNVKFFTSKNTHGSKCRIFHFVWSRYIALKLLWKIWGKDVKEGPPFEKSGKKTSSTRGPRLKDLGKRRQRVVPIWKNWEKDVKEGTPFEKFGKKTSKRASVSHIPPNTL